jgi:atypical dual specificity phosphatase
MEPGDIIRKIYGFLLGRPMNASFISDYLCGSARPMSKKEVDWLIRTKGVKAILSLTEGPLPPEWLSEVASYRHVPIKNHAAPTISQLSESIDFITENIKESRKTAVHCAAGQGRTGTVLAAYLCASQNLLPKDAIETVRAKRGGSVEKNSGQEEAVFQYFEFIREQKEKNGGG